MGTRHIIAVMHEGKYIISQYGQFDGYPEGQGVEILNFLKNGFNKDLFIEKCKLAYEPTLEEIDAEYVKCGAEPNSEFVDFEVNRKFKELHPHTSRETGSQILSMIQKSNEPFWLKKNLDFPYNSLHCEWCYVIDLDNNTFEIYEGFNKNPLTVNDRFYSEESNDNGYYGVTLKKIYSLSHLPETDKDFLDDVSLRG